jgi:hypothetical protein
MFMKTLKKQSCMAIFMTLKSSLVIRIRLHSASGAETQLVDEHYDNAEHEVWGVTLAKTKELAVMVAERGSERQYNDGMLNHLA